MSPIRLIVAGYTTSPKFKISAFASKLVETLCKQFQGWWELSLQLIKYCPLQKVSSTMLSPAERG